VAARPTVNEHANVLEERREGDQRARAPQDRLAARVDAAAYGTVLVLVALSTIDITEIGVGHSSELVFGVGLATWIAHLYAEQHTFAMRALPEGGTEVRITLPFRAGPPEVAEHAHAAGADRGR